MLDDALFFVTILENCLWVLNGNAARFLFLFFFLSDVERNWEIAGSSVCEHRLKFSGLMIKRVGV